VKPVIALASLALAAACARKPATAASTPLQQGHQLYVKYCGMCHGPEAKGYAADNAPSLRNPTFLSTASDAFLRAGIERGRPGTAMAGYGRAVGGPLAPTEVDAIMAFVRDGGPAPLALPAMPVTGDAKRGKPVYDTQCLQCHGTQTQRINAVHLANPVLLATASDAFLRHAVVEGRPQTPMLAFKDKLTPQQIDDVVAYVRSMAVIPAVPAPVPAAMAAPAAPPPRQGPVVLNPKGKHADFTLKDDRLVSLDQVKQALDGKRRLVIADARAPSDWLNLHITGAISAPYYELKSLDDIPNDGTWVVAYCACPHHASGVVVDELRKRGYKRTAVLDEGIFAWQRKGYPVVAAPGMLQPPAPPPAAPPPGMLPRPPAPSPAAHK
jgi:cytochrome c oxidase cbb3-type subunit 3/ubiquinol-cytochrome c reductase cytochrome c subunit